MYVIQGKEESFIETAVCISCMTIISYALGSDLRSYRVKNSVFITGWIISLLLIIINYGWLGILRWSVRFIIPVIVLIPFYMARGIGGADVKAFTVISTFMGCNICLTVLVVSIIFASIISVLYLIFSGELFRGLHSLAADFKNLLLYGINDFDVKKMHRHRIHYMLPIWMALFVTLVSVN